MSRDSQGVYSLPAGNPVTPGTVIEADWANSTMEDIAVAITDSLPRNGSAPMTGPLTLANSAPTNGRHAASKAYVDKFIAYSTGMPVGSVVAYAAGSAPSGFLLCDGSTVSRTIYATLFSLIGTTYGAGDNATTFNLPDLRDYFVRGRGANRAIGDKQAGTLQSHNHALSDPGHAHTIGDPGHAHTSLLHDHGVTDPGHSHTVTKNSTANVSSQGAVGYWNAGGDVWGANLSNPTNSTGTGLTVDGAEALINGNFTGVWAAVAATGLAIGATGGTETRPQNVAMDYYIKAVNDSTTQIGVTSITSSDDLAISIDESDPAIPNLELHTNTAFGLVKLDANNKVPNELLTLDSQNFLGTFDASSNTLPVGTYANGDTYVISVAGTLNVYESDGTPVSKAVAPGWYIIYQRGLATPDGWYYIELVTSTTDGDKGDIVVSNSGTKWRLDLTGPTEAGDQVTGVTINKQVQSTVTSRYIGNLNAVSTQATAFTLPSYVHYLAFQNTLGAGSVITSQTGFQADATLVGAGTNIGFSGAIPAGANRWNLYMSGTAQNYLAGKLGIGVTVPTQELDVNGNVAISGTGRRITGDFSNATFTNRVIFQTSTTNSNTGIFIAPNGTATSSNISAANNSDVGNASLTQLICTSTSSQLVAGATGTGTALPLTFITGGLERLRIDTSGNTLVTSVAGLGYGVGAGGAVTQLVSKSEPVTLNRPTGKITMHNAALAGGASVSFVLNNTLLGSASVLLAQPFNSGAYVCAVQLFNGQAQIRVTNLTGGSLSDALVINFAIIKGSST